MHFSLRSVVCSLCVAVLIAPPAWAADTLQRGVLLERASAQVMLMRPSGGIEAVDVRSGQTRWVSENAQLPVLVKDATLLAMAGPPKRGLLPFAVIGIENGETRLTRFARLPAPARSLVDDRLGETFRLQADAEGFSWDYRLKGVPGALIKNSEQVQLDGSGPSAVKRTSDDANAVALAGRFDFDPAAGQLSERPVSGKSQPLPTIELDAGKATDPRRLRSQGGAHELRSEHLADGRYRWTVSERGGMPLGTMVSEYSYRPFEVLDNMLVFVVPLRIEVAGDDIDVALPTLIGYDLRAGKIAWKREVRDTEFRGPFPP